MAGRSYSSYGARHALRYLPSVLTLLSRKAFDRRTFSFRGKDYRYFHEAYNGAWMNERTVEIPIALEIIRRYPEEEVLEVGNVLRHYFEMKHEVVDKYERYEGVCNVDIADFQPQKRYSLIVCISTLEHIGFDESVKDSAKPARAVAKVRSLLSEKGMAVFTVPFGYNPAIDEAMKERSFFDDQFYMKRLSKSNAWAQKTWEEVEGTKHGFPVLSDAPFSPGANAITVGFIGDAWK